MEPNDSLNVIEPKKVSDSINTHENYSNNLQKYLPQNGGEIAASNPDSTPNDLYNQNNMDVID